MTTDQTPNPEPTGPSAAANSSDPKTVEADVVESTSEPTKASTRKAAAPKSQPDTMEKVKAVATELWTQAKPVLQKIGTQALLLGNRITDFLLDKAFPTAKEKFIQILPADFKAQAQEKIDPVKAKVVPVWQKVWPWIKKTLGPLWAKAIAFIREKLPQDLSGQLSDRFLNILLVTAIYLVWSFFSGLTHPSQAKQPKSDLTFPEVKTKPSMPAPDSAKPLTQTPPATAPKISTPPPVPKVAPAPTPKADAKPTVSPPKPPVTSAPPKPIEPVKKPEPKPEPITSKPQPIAPKPAETKPVETKPAEPKAPITPVKPVQPIKPTGPDLVALKADLVDVADRVVENATAMVSKVSVTDKQVKVELGDRWYTLSEQEQSKLASNLFSKSKKLDYERLEIRDAKGAQVARSPYIGNNMIILKRSTPKPPALPESTISPTSH